MSFALGLVLLAGGAVAFALGLSRLTGSALVAAIAGAAAPVLAVSLTSVTAHEYRLVPVTLALGSGVADIGLVLGVAAIARPLSTRTLLFSRGVAALLAANLLLMFLARDDQLSRFDGGVLLAAFAGAVVFLARSAKRDPPPVHGRSSLAVGLVVAGGAGLVGGAWLAVGALPGMISALRWNGVPLVLTLMAAAVSLPALVAAAWAARRGHGHVVMAAVVGACLCHTLLTFGAAAVVTPLPVPERVSFQLLPAALVFACLLLPVVATGSQVPRWEGAILVAAYAAFVAWQRAA